MEAVVRVLSRNGVEVVVPRGQACCGALNAHAGDRERARAMARRVIDALLVDGIDAVVVASAGCGSTMKEYGQLLRGDPRFAERAERFGRLTRDVHEFLATLPLDPPRARLDTRVTYQDACHLAHAQRISQPPRELIRAIPGLELVEMGESSVCCGAGGTYSLQQPEMSARLAVRKATNIASSGATVVVTSNPGCAIQMENALGRIRSRTRVAYVVDLLDHAYRLESRMPT
jgi:glycolate oxidase iron-sulfur subunit